MDLSCLAAISIPFTHGPFQSIRCDFVAASFNENAFSGRHWDLWAADSHRLGDACHLRRVREAVERLVERGVGYFTLESS
jgi:hypothetical protein